MKTTHLFMALLILFGGSCAGKKNDRSLVTAGIKTALGNTAEKKENESNMNAYTSLEKYIEEIIPAMDRIPDDRKEHLFEVAAYIDSKKNANEPANLIFICTHNSRRSHLSQIWAETAANYYGVAENIFAYSGGTEATAFNPRAVAAIERAGFHVENPGGDNPHYKVTFSAKGPEMECFSKKFDDEFNPTENFAAIMTCSHADKNCPFIPGASARVAIPYEDPKVADGTEYEAARYDERCRQIATEMFYLMSQVTA